MFNVGVLFFILDFCDRKRVVYVYVQLMSIIIEFDSPMDKTYGNIRNLALNNELQVCSEHLLRTPLMTWGTL